MLWPTCGNHNDTLFLIQSELQPILFGICFESYQALTFL